MHSFRSQNFFAGFSERTDGNLPLIDLSPPGVESYWKQILQANSLTTLLPRFAHQVHEDGIIEVHQDSPIGSQGKADGLITSLPGVPIGVFTADCLPILIGGKTMIAAVHAGWKGTRLDIAGKTISLLKERFQIDPRDLEIFLGPCIGTCCLELGDEVPPTFFETDETYSPFFSQGKKWHLDLRGLNYYQLLRQGAVAGNIKSVPHCTKCLHEKYFSYRVQKGKKGSMFSFIFKPQTPECSPHKPTLE